MRGVSQIEHQGTMFKINVEHEEGTVSGYLEITNGSMVSEVSLGTFGPISDDWYARAGRRISYVEFLEELRNRKECIFCCNLNYASVCCSFISNTNGTLTITAETDSMGKKDFCYKFCFLMTNEIFAEMEKLVITTKKSCDNPYTPSIEEALEWEEKYFPKDYVYGRGLAYE